MSEQSSSGDVLHWATLQWRKGAGVHFNSLKQKCCRILISWSNKRVPESGTGRWSSEICAEGTNLEQTAVSTLKLRFACRSLTRDSEFGQSAFIYCEMQTRDLLHLLFSRDNTRVPSAMFWTLVSNMMEKDWTIMHSFICMLTAVFV